MKRRIVIALLLMLACLPVYLAVGYGTAHAAGCYGNSCDYQDPQAMGCGDDAKTYVSAPIVYDDGVDRPVAFGLLELRYSAVCDAAWTKVTSYIGVQWIIAQIRRVNTPGSSSERLSGYDQIYTEMLGANDTMQATGCVTDGVCNTITLGGS